MHNSEAAVAKMIIRTHAIIEIAPAASSHQKQSDSGLSIFPI
jgi:hypothetical protein